MSTWHTEYESCNCSVPIYHLYTVYNIDEAAFSALSTQWRLLSINKSTLKTWYMLYVHGNCFQYLSNSSWHLRWGPYTILWVTDRSIYCHLARSAMNYLLYYTEYMQICQTTCFCYCISKKKTSSDNYIDRARSIY